MAPNQLFRWRKLAAQGALTATSAQDEVVAASECRALPNQIRELQRHTGGDEARRHDGRVAVERSNRRWCSDGFEIGCDNGEKVWVAFALDCCDREVLGHVATTEGIKGGTCRT